MKFRRQSFLTAILVTAIGLFIPAAKAHADTYQFLDLTNDMGSAGNTSVYGITASGTVVLVEQLHAGVPQCANLGICTEYEIFVNGVMVSESPTAPNLVYDNGTSCVPTTSFATTAVGSGVCNNGHEVYVATPTSTGQTGNFDGADITDTFAASNVSVSEVDLNSIGDFAFDANHNAEGPDGGEIIEAIDLTTTPTPEPGSIFLLGTGLLATGTLRRRYFQRGRRVKPIS